MAPPAGILRDVVALIRAADAVHTAKPALTTRLEKHGARVATRLGKEVTHIIFERRHSQRPKDKAADDAELLDLYKKLDKYDCPPSIVSPLWLEESISAGRRLVEKRYLVGRPKESLLAPAAPGSAGGAKKRRRGSALPKPQAAYELDLLEFSSTQAIVQEQAPPSDATSPRHGGAGSRGSKRGRGAAPAARGRGRPTAPTTRLPAVQEQPAGEAGEQQRRRPSGPAVAGSGIDGAGSAGAGAATQAVARILTVELPAEPVLAEEEGDELDTPLSVRIARSSLDRSRLASAGRSPWSDEQAGEGAGAGGQPGAGRSRLARVSGPHDDCTEAGAEDGRTAAEAEAAAFAQAAAGAEDAADPMEEDPPAPRQQAQQREEGKAQDGQGQQDSDEQQDEERGRAQRRQQEAEEQLRRQKGVAARFSTRQLERALDKPLLLHKATPLPGTEPPLSAEAQRNPIPIPFAERVVSPWEVAAALPDTTQPSQRTSQKQQQQHKSPLGPGGNDNTPLELAAVPHRSDGKLPSPWSTLRAWDKQQAQQAQQAAAAEAPGRGGAENAPQQQPQEGAVQEFEMAEGEEMEAGAASADAAATTAAATGPSRGWLAVSSCDASIADLAKAATGRLRGLRLCPEGREDGKLTHLIIGSERRTLKVMLAVAAGAWLVSPAWLTASLEAGYWLPEAEFVADVRFTAAAERARRSLEAGPSHAGLLAEQAIYIHLPDTAKKLMGRNAAALKRVAAVLGAKPASLKSCSLCVVVGGGKRPASFPSGAACVREEWLLQAAESYEVPAFEEHQLR